MATSHHKDIIADLEQLIKCAICREKLSEPKLLPCQHSFCLQCLKLLIETHSGGNISTNQLQEINCPACRRLTFLSHGGATRLPADIKANQIAAIIKKHQLCEEKIITISNPNMFTNVFEITDEELELDEEIIIEPTAVLQWFSSDAHHIWDLDFMADGSLICVNSNGIKRLSNFEGSHLNTPFETGMFRNPCGIAINQDKYMMVAVDWFKGNNEGFLTVYTKNGRHDDRWNVTSHLTTYQPNGVTVSPTGEIIVCGNDHIKDVDLLLKYDRKGNEIWCKSYPSDTVGPYLAVNETGEIFVSTPTKNAIDIYSGSGENISAFKSHRLREPRGMCFNSEGHLLVADHTTKTISAFDKEANFVEEIVKVHGLPNSIALYQDKYLAVSDWQDRKLYMYELNK